MPHIDYEQVDLHTRQVASCLLLYKMSTSGLNVEVGKQDTVDPIGNCVGELFGVDKLGVLLH